MSKHLKSAIVSIGSTTLTDEEKRVLSEFNPLGVTLFQRNIKNKEQIKNIIKDIKETLERDDVLICVDQEGGRVARFKPPYFRSYLSQKSIGSIVDEQLKKRVAYLQALLIADELKEMGVSVNYAPCVDVLYDETASVLKTRCFSADEKEVVLLAKEMIFAYQQQGIVPCIKHVPGHGRTLLDPHLDLPKIDVDFDCLKKDFYPFTELADLTPMMMTAHIVLPCIDDKPITQSKKSIDEIVRKEIGFNGFLISDAIDMKALKGSIAEKTTSALEAGCDAVCYCMGKTDELRQVLENATCLSDKSLERYERLLKWFKNEGVSVSKENVLEYDLISEQAPVFLDDYDAVEVLHHLNGKSSCK